MGPKVAKPRARRKKSKRHKECRNKLKSIVVTSSTTKDTPNLAALKQNMKGPSFSTVFSDNKNSNFAAAKISRESPSLALPEIKVDSSSCAKLCKIIKVSSKLSWQANTETSNCAKLRNRRELPRWLLSSTDGEEIKPTRLMPNGSDELPNWQWDLMEVETPELTRSETDEGRSQRVKLWTDTDKPAKLASEMGERVSNRVKLWGGSKASGFTVSKTKGGTSSLAAPHRSTSRSSWRNCCKNAKKSSWA